MFSEGERFRQSPLVVHYRFRALDAYSAIDGSSTAGPQEVPLQAGVSVSSRHFKKAVDRNLLKRRMREAYRKQKDLLQEKLEGSQLGIDIFWVYVESRKSLYEEIYSAVEKSIEKLLAIIEKKKDLDGNE